MPRSLPNLHSGYLFNADRHLDGGVADGEGAGLDGRDEAPHVNVYEVSFDGSLIYGNIRKGLISYPLQKTSRSSRIRSKSKVSSRRAPKRASLQLELGDKVGGYAVQAIEVDQIIFVRGSEKVIKSIHDEEKIRSTEVASRKSSSRVAKRATPLPKLNKPSFQDKSLRRRIPTPPPGKP